jgi:hypothetical protein
MGLTYYIKGIKVKRRKGKGEKKEFKVIKSYKELL